MRIPYLFILSAVSLTLLRVPAIASSWNPTLLVNSESFLTIDDGDGIDNIALEFGNSLQFLQYNTTDNRFEFNKSVYINSDLEVMNSMSGTSFTISGTPDCDRLATTGSGIVTCGATQVIQQLTSVQPVVTNADVVANLGSITRHRFDGIAGITIPDLTGNANYPNNPSVSDTLTTFEIPQDIGDNYGTRVFGYVVAPTTGNYRFWIASDDYSQLNLSTDLDPANKTTIASVTGYTASRQWTKYASQQSALIPLTAGQAYFIEGIMKEQGGLDNMAVRWQLPSTAFETPIPGSRLAPYITIPYDEQSVDTETDVVTVDTTDASINLLLPAYAGQVRQIIIKKTTTDSNFIRIEPNGSETIDGSGSYTIPGSSAGSVTLQTDGTNIYVIGAY